MKLYLTLDNEEGNKIERAYKISEEMTFPEIYNEVESMMDSMISLIKEEIVNEANRLVSERD